MKNIKYQIPIQFEYENSCLINTETLLETGKKLIPEIERVKHAWTTQGYESVYAALNLVQDRQILKDIKKIAQEKKALKPTMLIVIGIGGSSLGLKAIHQALYGSFYNEQNPEITLYIADTIDTDHVRNIFLLAEQELETGNKIILNIISKSGTTLETIINAQLFISLIRCAHPKTYQQYVVITTEPESPLWSFANSHSFTKLPIQPQVGGRYSVFSAAGLFPLALLDVAIDKLIDGAYNTSLACLKSNILENPAALRALILAEQYKRDIHIHDMFIFSTDLSEIGAWYRQLMGESLGKTDTTKDKKKVGITPTTSVGTTDLHSVGQLYLGGPYVQYTTFVSVEENKNNFVILNKKAKELKLATLEKKWVHTITLGILQGVKQAYTLNKRPFTAITIPEKSEYCIGMLMQLHMFEIIYTGFLLNVNPFDQPDVELYKKEAYKIVDNLSKEKL